jgi:hypothetical protein
MLMPQEILDKMLYYHHDMGSDMGDIVTVTYAGWLWQKNKVFTFKRITSYQDVDRPDMVTYAMTEGCKELIKQLHTCMEEKLGIESEDDEDESEDELEEKPKP